jgi:hypothetical protein
MYEILVTYLTDWISRFAFPGNFEVIIPVSADLFKEFLLITKKGMK